MRRCMIDIMKVMDEYVCCIQLPPPHTSPVSMYAVYSYHHHIPLQSGNMRPAAPILRSLYRTSSYEPGCRYRHRYRHIYVFMI
jgi:hypothetical protein